MEKAGTDLPKREHGRARPRGLLRRLQHTQHVKSESGNLHQVRARPSIKRIRQSTRPGLTQRPQVSPKPVNDHQQARYEKTGKTNGKGENRSIADKRTSCRSPSEPLNHRKTVTPFIQEGFMAFAYYLLKPLKSETFTSSANATEGHYCKTNQTRELATSHSVTPTWYQPLGLSP